MVLVKRKNSVEIFDSGTKIIIKNLNEDLNEITIIIETPKGKTVKVKKYKK